MSNVSAVFFASPAWRTGLCHDALFKTAFFSSLAASGGCVVAGTVLDQLCDGREDSVTALTITRENCGVAVVDEAITDVPIDAALSCLGTQNRGLHVLFVDVLVTDEVFILYKNLIQVGFFRRGGIFLNYSPSNLPCLYKVIVLAEIQLPKTT